MAMRPTDPETESTIQGGWVRAKHDIPADEEAVVLESWPSLTDEPDETDEEADEDEPTQETESSTRIVVPRRPT